MQGIDSLINKVPHTYDIQPYHPSNTELQFWLGWTIFFLVSIGLALVYKRRQFVPFIAPFLFSEPFAFDFYNSNSERTFLEVLLGVFFVFQLISLLFILGIFPLEQFNFSYKINLLVYCTGAILFLLLKLLLFTTLKYLLPTRVDFNYYIFNYSYYCFISSFFLLFINFFLLNYPFDFPPLFFGLPLVTFYLLILVRGLLISNRYNILGSIYFFLYLCTLEFIPIILLAKAI